VLVFAGRRLFTVRDKGIEGASCPEGGLPIGVEFFGGKRKEIAFDAGGVEDAELDMMAGGDGSAGIDGVAFGEGAADGVEAEAGVLLGGGPEMLEYCAIQLSIGAFIDGKGFIGLSVIVFHTIIHFC
jgi:hypothetical protein